MKTRRNKLILFAFTAQLIMPLCLIALVYVVSLNGQTVVLEMTGHDPYDALRGRYLMLDNPDTRVPLDPASVRRYEATGGEKRVYVILENDPEKGVYRFTSATLDRPAGDIPYIKCMSRYLTTYQGDPHVYIYPEINQYYLNEKHADKLDQTVRWDTSVRLTLKIWYGMYVMDSIEVDGQRY